MKHNLGLALLAASVAGTAGAQQPRIVSARPAFAYSFTDANSARIGVGLGDNGVRDTAGVLVNSVVADGPAAKAGIKEGDRIQSINGVNLKMAKDDAEDAALVGMMSRRLTRELDKLKAGDDVELRVLSGGSAKSLRVKTVAAHELDQAARKVQTSELPAKLMQAREDRVALGLSIGGSTTKRDTLGIFVMRVTEDGPAEKAGIVEGDRIAKINAVDLRVPGTDAGDAELARARMRRFNQELAKIKAGDAVTLTVVSGGRQRDVRVNAVKASELHGDDGFSVFFGDGFHFPNIEMPTLKLHGNIEGELSNFKFPRNAEFPFGSFKFPNGTVYYRNGDIEPEIRAHIEQALERARSAVDEARKSTERVRIPIVKKATIKS